MDTPMTAATELAAAIPEMWSAAFYPTLKEKMVFAGSVAQDYQGEIAALGDTVNITSFPQFDVAQEVSEAEAVDAEAITASNTQLIINKQLAKDFIITRKADLQSLPVMNALRDLALHAILKKMQQIVIAEIVPNASAPDHSIAFDSGTTLALADILEAKELLDDADCEEFGRVMILGSAQYNDLFNITGFTSKDFLPGQDSPLSSGAVSLPLLGFNVRWTSEVGNVAYFFHPIFLQLAVQQAPTPTVYDMGVAGKRAMRVNMECLMGVKQLSGLRVVTVG